MSFQNVSTPRFFVDILQFFSSKGIGSHQPDYPATGLNPSSFVDIPTGTDDHTSFYYTFKTGTSFTFNYWGLLGHTGATIEPSEINLRHGNYRLHQSTQEEIVNFNGGATTPITFSYDGFSLAKMVVDNELTFSADASLKIRMGTPIGCFTMGNIYNMSHAADLNLTMTREYGGVKTIETKGGVSLSNAFYTSPPKWGTKEAWQLGDQDFSVGGRRIWDLSFSYLSDSSVFPDNPTEISDGGGWEVDDTTPDFMSEVLKITRGSMLPFIFQPDKNNNNIDQFAICKFDMKSFKFKQVSNGIYNISLKIREIW